MIHSFRDKDSEALSLIITKEENMFNAMRPIHPGEILREELNELGLSANGLAYALKVPTNRITAILNGKRAITANTALRLARYFGNSAAFWMNLQIAYDLKTAQAKSNKLIERDVQPRAA